MWLKKDLIDKQARFWELMAQGSTLVAACDTVGVNRRTVTALAPSYRRADPAHQATIVGTLSVPERAVTDR